MSIKFMSLIWSDGPQRQSDRFVLLALADYANDDGECWPSIAGIVRKTCLSERGVQAIIKRLQSDGWLQISVGGGRKGCNFYTIKTPQEVHPAQDAPSSVCTTPPHMDAENPAGDAPEPSLTTNEPSLFGGDDPPPPKPKRKPRKKKSLVPIPDGWVPNDQNIADALKKNFSQQEIEHEASQFRDHHLAKGSTFKDWDAAWRTWLGNARKFSGNRNMAGGQAPGGYGQGGSIASVVARRRLNGEV